jgi:hypothetical protein
MCSRGGGWWDSWYKAAKDKVFTLFKLIFFIMMLWNRKLVALIVHMPLKSPTYPSICM